MLSHSLYQNKEIAIRELVSNASDALDKYRFTKLTTGGAAAADLNVSIEPAKDEKLLVIRDNGIGMTRDELVRNLGTIARSGSLEFLNQARSSTKDKADAELSLIGSSELDSIQRSCWPIASRCILAAKLTPMAGRGSPPETENFSISELPELTERGTQIRLHLKDGLDEFTDPIRLKYILRKYSTFVPHPIFLGA